MHVLPCHISKNEARKLREYWGSYTGIWSILTQILTETDTDALPKCWHVRCWSMWSNVSNTSHQCSSASMPDCVAYKSLRVQPCSLCIVWSKGMKLCNCHYSDSLWPVHTPTFLFTAVRYLLLLYTYLPQCHYYWRQQVVRIWEAAPQAIAITILYMHALLQPQTLISRKIESSHG